ncbi:MAG TPA: hypothetical protein VIC30_10190, partial [Orrella sp.]
DGIATENNQFYQTDVIVTGAAQSDEVALTSSQGTVTIVLGQRTGSDISSSGNCAVVERSAVISNEQGSDNLGLGEGGGDASSTVSNSVSDSVSDSSSSIVTGPDQAGFIQAIVEEELGQSGQSSTSAGSLDSRLVTGEQALQTPASAQGNAMAGQSNEVLFDAEIEVGEIDAFTCEAPPTNIVIQPEDC